MEYKMIAMGPVTCFNRKDICFQARETEFNSCDSHGSKRELTLQVVF